LRAYVRWSSSSRQSRVFLGAALEDVHRLTVGAGDTLFIPGGWPHAVYTPVDSLVVGGNFVHTANLALQCLVYRIEDHLRVKASYRYPQFKQLCLHTARWMCSRLPKAAEEAALEAADAPSAAGSASGVGQSPLEPPLTGIELEELSELYAMLKLWLFGSRSSDVCPPADIPEARTLLIRLRMRLQAAGACTDPVVDTFAVETKEVRRREREPAAEDHVPLLPGLPDELCDGSDDSDLGDDDDEPRVKRKKQKKAAAKAATPKRPPPPAKSVRDRLAKKLGMKVKGRR